MRYEVADHIRFSYWRDEVIVVDTNDGSFRFLNATAAAIWEAIDSLGSSEAATDALCELYGVGVADAKLAVDTCLGQLEELGSLVSEGGPAASGVEDV